MSDKIGLVILAAGKGTRLKLDIPKALSPIQGRTLIDYVISAASGLQDRLQQKIPISIVVGHMREAIEKHVSERYSGDQISCVVQKEQLGTADALKSYFAANKQHWNYEYTFILCADTPLVTSELLHTLAKEVLENGLDAVAATFKAADPTGYGRIIRGAKGFKIVEQKDASLQELQVDEVNSGIYVAKTSYIKGMLDKIDSNNKAGEFYLTDMFKQDANVSPVMFEDSNYFLGVNNLVQLEEVTSIVQKQKIQQLQLGGVIFLNSSSCYVEDEVEIAPGTTVYPNVTLMGKTKIGRDCIVETGVVIKSSSVADNCRILAHSNIEDSIIESHCSVGPSARLRPGTVLGIECKIGNFVEIKKSILSPGVKVSHLSYVGDAEIGKNTNIGCGFITCNYDGAKKHKTIIGDNSFIGSDCQTVAPVRIGNNAYVGSGSTINKDVPDGAFAIARERQVTKEGMASRFLKTNKD